MSLVWEAEKWAEFFSFGFSPCEPEISSHAMGFSCTDFSMLSVLLVKSNLPKHNKNQRVNGMMLHQRVAWNATDLRMDNGGWMTPASSHIYSHFTLTTGIFSRTAGQWWPFLWCCLEDSSWILVWALGHVKPSIKRQATTRVKLWLLECKPHHCIQMRWEHKRSISAACSSWWNMNNRRDYLSPMPDLISFCGSLFFLGLPPMLCTLINHT